MQNVALPSPLSPLPMLFLQASDLPHLHVMVNFAAPETNRMKDV